MVEICFQGKKHERMIYLLLCSKQGGKAVAEIGYRSWNSIGEFDTEITHNLSIVEVSISWCRCLLRLSSLVRVGGLLLGIVLAVAALTAGNWRKHGGNDSL